MKITEVKNSVFELADVTHRVEAVGSGPYPKERWVGRSQGQAAGHRQVRHVITDQ